VITTCTICGAASEHAVCGACSSTRFQQVQQLTVAQVSKALGFGTRWVRDHLADFPGHWRLGREIRIPLSAVRSFIHRQQV
jgi:hypothetical protein